MKKRDTIARLAARNLALESICKDLLVFWKDRTKGQPYFVTEGTLDSLANDGMYVVLEPYTADPGWFRVSIRKCE